MQTKTKAGAVTFTHDDTHRGEVVIERGALSMSVPFDALLVLIAGRVRHDMVQRLERMTPAELVNMGAARAGVSLDRIAS